VIDALSSIAGNNVYKTLGEFDTPTDNEVKDPSWMKVVVSTQDEVTV
jgi:hypothetical protein